MIERHDLVESTQTLAHGLADGGAVHGTAVAARVQTGGRGTRGRTWVSGAGGLWLSVILRPPDSSAAPLASLRIGLALARLLEAGIPAPIRVKWPNDLMVADRKLAGILCESRWIGDRLAWMVVGIGLNVRNELPGQLESTAIRLADLGYADGPDELAESVAEAVLDPGTRPGPLGPAELAAFSQRDWLLGRAIAHPVAGRAAGITPMGRLIVETAAGRREETVGSITLAGLAPDEATR